MFDTENRHDRKRSLLAYVRDDGGQDDHGEAGRPHSGSLLAMAGEAEPTGDAVLRHRTARSRREERLHRAAHQAMPADQPTLSPAQDAPVARPAPVRLSDTVWGRISRLTKKNADAADPEFAQGSRLPDTSARPISSRPADEAAGSDDDDVSNAGDHDDDRQWKPLIDPAKVIGGVGRSRMLILACTILGALLGVAVALSTPKKYEAATELLIDPRDLKLVDRDLTQSGFSNEATLAIVENQVRVITSGTVLNKVVDQLHLDTDPEFNGQGSGGGLLSGLRSLLSGGAGADDPGRRRALAVNHLAESLSVERGGKTFVVVITTKTQSGEKSALIANTMAEVFLKTYGELQSDTAGRATDELTARLTELRASVEAAERKVETFKAENDIIDPQGRLITDDELMKLNDQLSVTRARTLELNAKAASARTMSVDSVVGGVLPEALASPTMTELRSQYAALNSEADRQAVRLGPRHPQLQAIQAQLAGAREQISAELRRIVSSGQTELKRSVQLEQELSSRLAQLKVRQGDVSRDMVTLRELEREAAAKRAVYEAFLLRARETGEQRDINTANMSVISVAYPPLQANGPSRSTIAMTGIMLGFLAGVGLGGLRGAYESLSSTARQRRRRRATGRREISPAARAAEASSAPSGAKSGGFAHPEPTRSDQGYGQAQFHAAPQDDEQSQPAAHVPHQLADAPLAPVAQAASPHQPTAPASFDPPPASQTPIEEIRASLRDFRHAVEELAEARTRRRYF